MSLILAHRSATGRATASYMLDIIEMPALSEIHRQHGSIMTPWPYHKSLLLPGRSFYFKNIWSFVTSNNRGGVMSISPFLILYTYYLWVIKRSQKGFRFLSRFTPNCYHSPSYIHKAGLFLDIDYIVIARHIIYRKWLAIGHYFSSYIQPYHTKISTNIIIYQLHCIFMLFVDIMPASLLTVLYRNGRHITYIRVTSLASCQFGALMLLFRCRHMLYLLSYITTVSWFSILTIFMALPFSRASARQ